MAARENRITVKKMKKLQNELQFILHDLARKNKNDIEVQRLSGAISSIEEHLSSTPLQKS